MEQMPKCFVEKEFEKKRAHDIIKVLDEKNFSVSVCEWGCRALTSIAGQAMQTQNTESMADFLDDGGCEALIHILQKFCTVNTNIAAQGCLTVCILAWSLRDLKEFLGEIGACEIIVFVTSMNIGDAGVSEYGSAAIGLLAKNNISNSFKLAEAGACDVIAQVGNFGFNLRHERCIDISTNVCLAFAQLSEAVNAGRLMECGASALIVELMKLHIGNTKFAAAAVKALCSLSSLNAQHREDLGRAGACECILRVLEHYDSGDVVFECCEAIMHLSLSPSNTTKFGLGGACHVIVSSLRTKLMEVDFGAEVCTGAMLNLVTYGILAGENRVSLIESGALELLRLAQMSTKASYRARENILKLLEALESIQNIGCGVNQTSVFVNNKQNNVACVIHGSEMKGVTVPLQVEVHEVIDDNNNDDVDRINISESVEYAHTNRAVNFPRDKMSSNLNSGVFEI
jgi:hypothetical protein